MKKLIITLDEEVFNWVKDQAFKTKRSVNKMIQFIVQEYEKNNRNR